MPTRPVRTRVRRLAALTVAVVAATVLGSTAHAAPLRASCTDPSVPLTVEESRLRAVLPRTDDPSRLQDAAFAAQVVAGGGFEDVAPQVIAQLCPLPSLRAATSLLQRRGEQLWQAAVARAQGRPGAVRGWLPASDDRPLYWTRLQVTAQVRQWTPRFALSTAQRAALITTFDRASRGMDDLSFPPGRNVTRVVVSGFDPFQLDGGDHGTAPGAAGASIRHGNPSGAIALALDGTTYRSADGTRQTVEAYVLPVNYTELTAGYLEDTVGPLMQPGPRRVDASITISQAGGSQFDIEQWNGRYHGVYPGNDLSLPCPTVGGRPQLAVDNPACDIALPTRWGGPATFDLHDPPQWTATTLPVAAMIQAHTGRGIVRPPGDTWPDPNEAFGAVWHTSWTEFPACTDVARVTGNSPVPTAYPPATPPVPPDPGSCAYEGGGGNYLSNESGYRNTQLRDHLGLDIPAGHLHTPDMQHFAEGNRFDPSDATFDAWRVAIVAQAANLVHVVGERSRARS